MSVCLQSLIQTGDCHLNVICLLQGQLAKTHLQGGGMSADKGEDKRENTIDVEKGEFRKGKLKKGEREN
jgi:hypothetical protein